MRRGSDRLPSSHIAAVVWGIFLYIARKRGETKLVFSIKARANDIRNEICLGIKLGVADMYDPPEEYNGTIWVSGHRCGVWV